MRSIVLTGPMGSGKSSVGRCIARRTGFVLVDLDELVVAAAGKSINQIFATEGEEVFRQLEHEQLAALAGRTDVVLATGGGAVLREDNRRLMRAFGVVVNLTAEVGQLAARLERADDRPLLNAVEPREQKIARLLQQREACYADNDIRIDTTGKSVEDVAELVLQQLVAGDRMELIRVQLGPQSYDIRIGSELLSTLGSACSGAGLSGRVALVTNPTVAALYAQAAERSLHEAGFETMRIEVPDGEAYKTARTLESIYDMLINGGFDRRCSIVALGGGVVGDMAGFAAATFLRGIPFVQVPTTLLAQVDSSVGGKTGIDHPLGKNLIGAFHQPSLVVADVATLQTLSEREYRAGLAEVVKYGVVLDREFFELLEQQAQLLLARDPQLLTQVVARCCRIKALVVEQDEKESGLRAVLNYGHTLGHAFETLAGYNGLVHGEAVAIGMALAAAISEREGLCSADERHRVVALLEKLGLPVIPPVQGVDELAQAIARDKKSRSGLVQYICNRGLGSHAVRMFTPAQLAESCTTGR